MNQVIREKAEALLKADPTMGRIRLCRELGIGRAAVRGLLKKFKVGAMLTNSVVTPVLPTPTGKTLLDFRQQFDISLRIREGVSKLNGVYMTDSEFRQFCNIPTSHWRQYADQDEFKKFRGKFPGGQLLWAEESMMVEMKRIAGIMKEF